MVAKGISVAFMGITVGSVFKKVIDETRNTEKEQSLLAAALKATGNQAGYSQGRLNQMASAMEAMTTKSAGEFNQAQTVLLGFTNIVGEQLPKALMAAADYSTRTGADMKASAEVMGRALDIPSAGMASLARQGFKFKDSQIEAAKQLEQTGNIAEAQQIIFDALNETYGGAAVAARDTFGGAIDALRNTVNGLLTGGSGSLEEAKKSINNLNLLLGSSQTKQAFDTMIGWVVDLTAAVAEMSVEFVRGIKHADGFFDAVVKYGLSNPFKSPSEHLSELRAELAKAQEDAKRFGWTWTDSWKEQNAELQRSLRQKIGYWQETVNAELDKRPENAMRLANDRPRGGASLTQPDMKTGDPGSVNLKDRPDKPSGKPQTEKDAEAARRFLDTLKQQVFQTQEKTAYEKLFFDIQHKGLKLSESQLDEAIGLVTVIDMAAEAEETRRARLEQTTALYEQQNRLAAQAALYELEMSTYGMGNNAAAEMRERISLMQQHQQELRKMQQDQAMAVDGAETEGAADKVRAMYAERLLILQQTHSQELAMYDDYIAQKRQKEADWHAGVTSGLQTYLENARDVYSQVQDITVNAFGAAENALVDFVKTGELDVRGMLSGIGEDIVRMLVRTGIQMMANKLLGDTLQAAGIATSVAAGSATAAAWAPAAAMASLASFGANAAPASAGIASTMALSQALALTGFADGGYTGPGGKYTPAGIVHAGEGVLSQRDMAALGGPAAFEQFRASLHRGYAEGGVVGSLPVSARPDYFKDRTPADPEVTVNLIGAPEGTTVQRRRGSDDEYIIDVVLDDARRNGRFTRATQAMYGMRRVGR